MVIPIRFVSQLLYSKKYCNSATVFLNLDLK